MPSAIKEGTSLILSLISASYKHFYPIPTIFLRASCDNFSKLFSFFTAYCQNFIIITYAMFSNNALISFGKPLFNLKGYLNYKTIVFHKVALTGELNSLFEEKIICCSQNI